MSLKQRFDLVLKVVVHPGSQPVLQRGLDALKADLPALSFSPAREAQGLEDCLECIGSAVVDEEQKALILSKWDNDWDESEERGGLEYYWAYAFNTKMFAPELYYLELEFRPVRSRT